MTSRLDALLAHPAGGSVVLACARESRDGLVEITAVGRMLALRPVRVAEPMAAGAVRVRVGREVSGG